MSLTLNDRSPAVSPPEVAVDEYRGTAHLLVPMTRDAERYGVSVCGYPAEYLTVRSDLSWSQVLRTQRCDHCDASRATGEGR